MSRLAQTKKSGFSIIEVIVSVALFAIIITVALGSLILVIDANKRSKGIKLVVNNLNLAMESMSREIRVGEQYCENSSGSNCDSLTGSTDIHFVTDVGDDVEYRLNAGAVERVINGGTALQMTGSDVIVDSLLFYIRGTQTGDSYQPSVLIRLNGHIGVAGEETEFNIETTVSQRKLAP